MALRPFVSLLVLSLLLLRGNATACPFCTSLGPTLVQQREAAQLAVLGELTAKAANQFDVRVHHVLSGKSSSAGEVLHVPAKAQDGSTQKFSVGSLVLVMQGEADWSLLPVDETAYAYIARSPSLRTDSVQRLRYFARFLEHPNPLIAEDAYLEFGHAPFDEVRQAADMLESGKLRLWLLDPKIPGSRKGFYGMALGLGKEAGMQENLQFLAAQVTAEADDFRAGFDGILGGYLLLGGESALKSISQDFLANPQAATGDVRHAMTALRFYYEFGRGIPKLRIASAMALLLKQNDFAPAAIVDLARWEHWDSLQQVSSLWPKPQAADAGLERAIVGYLTHCPNPEAAALLKNLRRQHPQRVGQAEQFQLAPPDSTDR